MKSLHTGLGRELRRICKQICSSSNPGADQLNVAASESEPLNGLARGCRCGLLRGFLALGFSAFEVACDDFDTSVEVVFEQRH